MSSFGRLSRHLGTSAGGALPRGQAQAMLLSTIGILGVSAAVMNSQRPKKLYQMLPDGRIVSCDAGAAAPPRAPFEDPSPRQPSATDGSGREVRSRLVQALLDELPL